MDNGLLSEIILLRDGTSQAQRQVSSLRPESIPVEERTLEDWITFAQQFAAELTFFDNNNQPAGTWESFLTDSKIPNQQYIADILAYVNDPNTFSGDTEKMRKLSRPHLVLFISFLQLLGYVKDQINGFTKKHLDFFYYEILGLTRKGPVPDVANVIIQLADDVQALFVAKGTGLLAGKDSSDKDLVYVTEKDTVISRAAIQNIKTLYTGKKTTTLHQLLQDPAISNPNERLLKMMQLVLGDPQPGDPLPAYGGKMDSIEKLSQLSVADDKAVSYITGKLMFSKDEFTDLITNFASNWSKTEETLISAFRRKELKRIRLQENDPQKGFLKMFQFALGNPQPGDSLPDYKGKKADLDAIKKDLDNVNIRIQAGAELYLKNSLLLSKDSFNNSLAIRNKATATDADWITVYSDIALAQQKKRSSLLAEPVQVQWFSAYANGDAVTTAFASGNSGDATLSFNTFGKGHADKELVGTKPLSIGFAITSAQLLLQEGKRTITATLVFADNPLAKIPEDTTPLLSFFVSTGAAWFKVASPVLQYGNVARDSQGQAVVTGDNAGFVLTKTGVYNALQVQLILTENDPAIVAPDASDSVVSVQSQHPVVAAILNQSGAELSNYKWFKDAVLQQIAVRVQVEGLKALALQSDDTVLNPKKPFEPFGSIPEGSSHFYFAHSEICSKPLDSLTLKLEWMNQPTDLRGYYEGYFKLNPVQKKIDSNKSITAGLKYVENGVSIKPIRDVQLFNDAVEDPQKPHIEKIVLSGLEARKISGEGDVLDWKRYFLLELNQPDFQHTIYPTLLTKKLTNPDATTADGTIYKNVVLNPPYTPKLKSFSVDYSTSFTIKPNTGLVPLPNHFFHITAFGYVETGTSIPLTNAAGQVIDMPMYLLPQFQNEGLLYIGISNLFAPQNLSLFFQMAEGSANPDLEKPAISWNYLNRNNIWQPLQGTSLVSDTTNGLLNTGIIEFAIPADATNTSTMLGEGLYWLQAGVAGNAEAIPDTVAVFTQAVSTRFIDNDNAPEHFLTPLPPGSIKETANPIPQIDKIIQPFSSLKGKPAEADEQFYIRASERLRHKGRALTMWDYEYLVLEQFPEIYKVKCVPVNTTGVVSVIVIPDIKGKLPFNPFQPKVPSNLLNDIQQYLEQRITTWATVKVKNPTYTQVKVRIAIKIKEGYSESFFVAKLEEDLIKYLAPWAYDTAAEVFLDRRIDADVIVNFVAEQFYIDYASDVYLFTSTNGKEFTSVNLVNRENYVQATDPGEILVSAPGHVIDIIRKDYTANNYRGIGYMKIGLDFKIG